jgi:membrane-bound metal-dependent hydrolase YbcI (DUF457 family)
MMGIDHSVSGAAAWVAITSTVPYTLGLDPLPVSSVLLGALVTAGAALLPDVDHHSATIAQSGGFVTKGIAAAASTASGGHRHGMHSVLAVAGFTIGSVLAARWEATVPVLGLIPAGSALLMLALVAFAAKALHFSRGGIVKLWLSAAVVVVGVLSVSPEQFKWLPTSVMLGVIVHLLGDIITTDGIPLLWPWVPKPPKSLAGRPLLSRMWKPNGYVSVPVLGDAGSAREWVMCIALSAYVLYGAAATLGLITIGPAVTA